MIEEAKPDLSRLRIQGKDTRILNHGGGLMKKIVVGIVGIVLLFLVFKIIGCLIPSKEPSKADTSKLLPIFDNTNLTATGYVVAQRQAAIASKASGRLKTLSVKEGDKVEANQIIGVIENDDIEESVKQADANLDVMKARVLSALAEETDAKLAYDRYQKLLKKDYISESEFDGATARYEKAKAEVALANANVAMAKSQVDAAKINLEYTNIRAPFAGTILSKNADVGEFVAPMASSANSKGAVVTIADMASLQIEADVSESNIEKVKLGQKCKIVLDSFPDKTYNGEVDSIIPTVDRAKATILVKIKFLDKDDKVIPEMSAKVVFGV